MKLAVFAIFLFKEMSQTRDCTLTAREKTKKYAGKNIANTAQSMALLYSGRHDTKDVVQPKAPPVQKIGRSPLTFMH
jgi:hypothetical protein